jgi:MFS family permease
MLLAADATGALLGGLVLEGRGLLKPSARLALILAMLWATALGCFAMVRAYPLAIGLLFLAGFFELSFSSMTQTLVQLNAPGEMRGRVLGLFNMAALGMRAFSGITVGLVGAAIGVHVSLAVAALALLSVQALLLRRLSRPGMHHAKR